MCGVTVSYPTAYLHKPHLRCGGFLAFISSIGTCCGKHISCAKKWFCDWGGRGNSEFQNNPTSLLPLLAGGRRFLIPNPKLYSPPSNQCSCEQLQGQAGIQSSKNLSPFATLHTTVLSAQAEPLEAVSCMRRSWCCLVVDSNELLCSLLGCSLQYL